MLTAADLAWLAGPLLVYAALHDLAARTVPNWLPVALLVIGLAARFADHTLVDGLLVAACTFAVLFALWILGLMGGGDVKLWAASALLIQPLLQSELNFILDVVLAGGVLALVYLVLFRLIKRPRASREGGLVRRALRAEAWRIFRRAHLPYACAIAGGALVSLLPLSSQR